MKPKPAHLGPQYGAQFEDSAVAAVYRRRPPYPQETFDLLLARVPTPGRSRVLEMGAGTGEIAIPLSEHVKSVDAVEASRAMLDIAEKQPGFDRVRWHNLRAEMFSYPTIYDLIICAQSLHWLDWATVFPRFVGSLDPQGWLVLVSQEALEGLPWSDELLRLIQHFSTNQDFEPYDLVDELQERGLFDVRGRESTWPVPFAQSVDDYIEAFHARNGFSRDRMSRDAAAAFDGEVRRLLLTHHPDGIIRGRNQSHICWGKPRTPMP